MGTKIKAFQLIWMVCLGMFSATAYALALSDIELNSYLNQKLDATIELKAASSSDLDALRVNLVSSSNNTFSSYGLKYEIVRGENGNFLRITSKDVIREPIVEFQVDINWPTGRVVREYSLLIDPKGN